MSPPTLSTRRSEDRLVPGRQDSNSAAEGPFSPAGLKVLVVDDDPMCLKVVSAMLRRCNYQVETKSNGHEALRELRDRQEDGQQFDLVLSDVHMPDMDGFKLLEQIGLELDLPVIMMSSDSDTGVVLRGVTHGAVDFLIKPVRIEELKNVWQHVVRRRSSQMSRGVTAEESGADQDGDSRVQGTKRSKEVEVLRAEHEGGSGGKKARVVWSVEMHQQFVYAVNTLGIDKAVPKRILDLMNVEGLTRENVASHLQKYRLYLKRVEAVAGKCDDGKEKSSAKDKLASRERGNDRQRGASQEGLPRSDSFVKQSQSSKSPPQSGKNQKTTMKINNDRKSDEPTKNDDAMEQRGFPASGSNHNLQAFGANAWPGVSPAIGSQGYYGNPAIYPPTHMAAGNPLGVAHMPWQQNLASTGMPPTYPHAVPPASVGGYCQQQVAAPPHPMYHPQVPYASGQPGASVAGPIATTSGAIQSNMDSTQAVSDAFLHGSTDASGKVPPSVEGNKAETNIHSTTGDISPEKTDLMSGVFDNASSYFDDGLPNIEGLQDCSRQNDPDNDILDLFIKGMEGSEA